MTKLEYTFKNDILFKMLFTKFRGLLKQLVADLLGIPVESIGSFEIINSEIPPDFVKEKFCRLDINMIVDGQRVDLEIQVYNEGDFPERSLYYWARGYSSTLHEGENYSTLPRTIIVSITAFKLFDCEEFHSEFRPLEVTRHTQLTDKQVLHYFELPKLPSEIAADDAVKLWLALFRAETEEDLAKLEAMEVPVMQEAIGAYRHITATEDFRERERMRFDASNREASALLYAKNQGRAEGRVEGIAKGRVEGKAEGIVEGRLEERKEWQDVVAKKDALLAEKDALIARFMGRQ